MQTTQFVVFQLANFFLYFFSGKYLITRFQSIPVDWIQNVQNIPDLSTDQDQLLKMCSAVSSGADVALRKPGPVVQSRWLTTAIRILRYYISCDRPTKELRQLAEFIMKVCAPVWFKIKSSPTIADGARHFFDMVQKSRFLQGESKKCVDEVLKRNAFFAHPENVLIAIITDESPDVRVLGWKKVKQAQRLEQKKKREGSDLSTSLP